MIRALQLSLGIVVLTTTLASHPAAAEDSGAPIRMAWIEGDVAGLTSIWSPDGKSQIGYIDYHQHRVGDRLEIRRIARFKDGSSDEDQAELQVGETMQARGGRSIIRNTKGVATVDIKIDVVNGHITGFSGLGDKRETYDEKVELPAGTYWGAMIFLVIKNFDNNATDGRLVFRTVVATPKPRVFDMELLRQGTLSIRRPGGSIEVGKFALRPTINFLIDPIIRMFAPETTFLVAPGKPPSMARFEGPRNYAGQKILIQ